MIAQATRLRRERASSGRFGDDPATAQLRQQRFEAQSRVNTLAARCRETNPEHRAALAALQEGLRDARHQLAALDAALAGPGAEVVALAPDEGERMSAAEAQAAARRRLHFLLIVLEGVPPTCTTAARTLRRAVGRELRELEQLQSFNY